MLKLTWQSNGKALSVFNLWTEVGMSGTLVPIKNLGYRWVPGTEKISEVGYRWVLGTEEILEVGYRGVPDTEEILEVEYRWVLGTEKNFFCYRWLLGTRQIFDDADPCLWLNLKFWIKILFIWLFVVFSLY